MWPHWAASSKVQLPSTASNCVLQPLESVTEFDVPVPILLCLPSVPLTPLPFFLLYSSLPSPSVFYLPLKAAKISFEICVCKFSFCCFRCFFFFCACLPELSFLLLPSPCWLPLFDRLSRFFYVCLFVMRYVPYEIWRIWYTEYVKLKFPTMLLLFLSAPAPRPTTFCLNIPHPLLSSIFIFPPSLVLVLLLVPSFVYFVLCDFRLCKWIL